MKIFNSLTNHKEVFEPIHPPTVGMYVCGVTVYDDCHLGHARSAVVFDVIRRYLEFRGYQVKYVKNFTDIDDKILHRAKQEQVSWKEIVEKYIRAYSRDMDRLNVGVPNVEPRATEHIPQIVEMIQTLVNQGYAYPLDGDVYFHVNTFKDYGKLSRRRLEDMVAGARVDVDERKQNPMDFAVWKKSKPDEPGWESPWGKGRPGWHIECSAMSVYHLGEEFDIHGGGKDLIFPHHENEIAQSCASTHKHFAKYWIHNGFVTIDEEKMSKSLGNFFTIQDIFEKLQGKEADKAETLRYFLLSTHYRSDLNFSDQALLEAKSGLNNLYDLFIRLEEPTPDTQTGSPEVLESRLQAFEDGIEQSMDDDFNTPRALAEIQRLRGDVNKLLSDGLSEQDKKKILKSFQKCGNLLGLLQVPPHDWTFNPVVITPGTGELTTASLPPNVINELPDEWIEQQIQKRREARERKEFAEADKIRQELASQGITLEDRPDGTTRWKR